MATKYISMEAASDLLAMALIDEWEPEYAQDRLSEIPAADVRTVVRGTWIRNEKYRFAHNCSVCGHIVFTGEKMSKFCPECGADMREDGTE